MRAIYNTSFIINEEIEQEWVTFVKVHYIGLIRQSGLVDDVIFTRVSIDQPEGKTYSLQLVFNTKKEMDQFLTDHLPAIEEKIIANYKNRYLCFSSVLEEL